jgi:tungstate transport system ATP-binding protein
MQESTPLYRIERLAHAYKGGAPVLAIDHWQMAAGGIIGLTGPNGSGKSTLLKLLGLLERPAAGNIFFKGLKTDPFAAGLRGRIALLTQEAYLLKRTVYKNIAYGLRLRGQRADEDARVGEAMTLVGLPRERFADRPWFALSGGEGRRVALAARLALRPEVLLLDEPTASVDDLSAQLMKEAVLHAHRCWGTSLIIASHDAAWLQEVCSDRVHLYQGRLLGHSAKTMLYGPWEMWGEAHVRMPLSEGQHFVAARPPAGTTPGIAAVDPRSLSILATGDTSEKRFIIEGILDSLTLDKPTGGIEATVIAGRTSFKIFIAPDAIPPGGLIPGHTVTFAYRPIDVEWLDVKKEA